MMSTAIAPASPMFTSIAAELVSQSVRMAEKESFQLLMARRKFCMDYYRDEVLAEDGGKDEYLKDLFTVFDKEQNKKVLPAHLVLEHIPLTKQIVDLKARIYKTQPERKVEANGQVQKAENYTELLKASRFFSFSKQLERYTELLCDVACGVALNAEKKLVFTLCPEYYPFYADDDQLQLDPVAILYPSALRDRKDGSQVWVYWDKEVKITFNGMGAKQTEEPNTYGVFPFFFSHRERPVLSHFGTPLGSLADANQAVDVAITTLNEVLHYNGFKNLAIIGKTGEGSIASLQSGASRAIIVEQGDEGTNPPSVNVLDMQSDFQQHVNTVQAKMEWAANNRNMAFQWKVESGAVRSGRALEVSNARDFEDREAQVEIRDEMIEQPLYRIVAAISRKFNLKVEQSEKFVADFPEQESGFPSVSDEIAWRDHELLTGQKSEIDFMMEDNPDLTEEEAVKKWNNNRKLNSRSQSVIMTDEEVLAILNDKDPEDGSEPVDQTGLEEETEDAGQSAE